MANDSYIHLIAKGEDIVVSGRPTFFAGHKIPGGTQEAPDGIFAEWRWDGRRLQVRNCRYGFYPMFYFVTPDEICVATSIPKIIAEGAPTELDEAALALFLRLGFYVGEDTPFRAIRALPPNASLDWTRDEIRLTGGIAFAKPVSMNRDDAIDAYVSLFRSAVRRRTPKGKFVHPLSGGKDSRHILFELEAAGYVPESCVTLHQFPPRADGDVEVARALALRMGLEHVVIEQSDSRVRAELRKNVRTSYCADEHAWMLPVGEYLDGRTETIYDGLGGDFLSSGIHHDPWKLSLFKAGDFERLADSYLEYFLEWHGTEDGLEFLLEASAQKRLSRDLARERLVEELKKHADAPNPMTSFVFWNRAGREIALAPHALMPASITVFVPYLDHAVYDMLAGLPPEMVWDRKFHQTAISRAFPDRDDVPFASSDVRRPHLREESMRFAQEFASYALTRKKRSDLVNYSVLLPRLARCARDGNRKNIDWLSPILALYLIQLEQAATGTGFSTDDDAAFNELAGLDLNTFETGAAVRFQAMGCGADLFSAAKEDFREARFLERQNAASQEILAATPTGSTLILVDDGLWNSRSIPERRVISFVERDGEYWGPPADDAAAIVELEALRAGGADFIVFVSSAFWWLNFYTQFAEHLRSNYRTAADTKLLVIFDLRPNEASGTVAIT